MELIIDPTKKPLTSRISANSIPTQPKAAKGGLKAGTKKTAKAKVATAAKKQNGKPRSKKPAKKTIEQLDQEMSDYFEKKD